MPVALTTVYVPWDEVAGSAVDTLHRMIAGEAVEMLIQTPVKLIDGDTW